MRLLAGRLGLRHIELDALRYEPNWVEVPDAQFRARVDDQTGVDRWSTATSIVQDTILARANLVLWKDYSLPVVFRQVLARTIRRLCTGETFSNGNRETLRRVLGPRSVVRWAVRSHGPRRIQYESLLGGSENLIPGETRRWVGGGGEQSHPDRDGRRSVGQDEMAGGLCQSSIPRIRKAWQHRNLVPVIGAGVSRAASDLPDWKGLLAKGIEFLAKRPGTDKESLDVLRVLHDKGKLVSGFSELQQALGGAEGRDYLAVCLGSPKLMIPG